MMDKKTLLAVALSIFIIVGYQMFMSKLYPKKPVEQKPAVTTQETEKEETQTTAAIAPAPPLPVNRVLGLI